jgi:hypothetical protein
MLPILQHTVESDEVPASGRVLLLLLDGGRKVLDELVDRGGSQALLSDQFVMR